MVTKIGIDVGGTFTDAVFIKNQEVVKHSKTPTRKQDLLNTVLKALDLLQVPPTEAIDNLNVSTTLVTNAIVQKRLPEVKLILFPGSGLKLPTFTWPIPYKVLCGELDFRGRLVKPASESEWSQLVQELKKEIRAQKTTQKTLVVISGKFSHRNNVLERELASYLQKEIPELEIALGSEWGQANFYRRSLTTYLNLACKDLFQDFTRNLLRGVSARGYNVPVRVLKADGGVLPFDKIRPMDSIHSGSAAGVLGALAQSAPEQSYIVVDIGGTTTDLGLVLTGNPLLSSHGARIGSILTNVHSLAVQSIPVGGDSALLLEQGDIKLAGYRLGPAYCLGGEHPTPTDAMRYLGLIDYGSLERAKEGLLGLVRKINPHQTDEEENPLRELAQSILNKMADQIATAIEEMLIEWRNEPAYKIWQVLHPDKDYQFEICLSGGAGAGIVSILEKRTKMSTSLTPYSSISNAIGAALAKPTFSWTLNLDTNRKYYNIVETGEQGKWQGSKRPYKEVETFLTDLARKQAPALGIERETLKTGTFDYFPLVEGYFTTGQIVRGSVYAPPGVTPLLVKKEN